MTRKELELAGAILYKCEGSRPRHNKPNGTCKIRYINKEAYLKLNEIIKKKLGKEAGFRLIK